MRLTVLSWNVSGSNVSAAAPAGFTLADKCARLAAVILRHAPDLVALQELFPRSPSNKPLLTQLAAAGYRLLSSSPSHMGESALFLRATSPLAASSVCGFDGIVVEKLTPTAGSNGSSGSGGEAGSFYVAGCHLAPGGDEEAGAERRMQLEAVFSRLPPAAPAVVLGDLNMRNREEGAVLSLGGGLCDAYTAVGKPKGHNFTWNGLVNRYYGPGQHQFYARFDRALLRGLRALDFRLVGDTPEEDSQGAGEPGKAEGQFRHREAAQRGGAAAQERPAHYLSDHFGFLCTLETAPLAAPLPPPAASGEAGARRGAKAGGRSGGQGSGRGGGRGSIPAQGAFSRRGPMSRHGTKRKAPALQLLEAEPKAVAAAAAAAEVEVVDLADSDNEAELRPPAAKRPAAAAAVAAAALKRADTVAAQHVTAAAANGVPSQLRPPQASNALAAGSSGVVGVAGASVPAVAAGGAAAVPEVPASTAVADLPPAAGGGLDFFSIFGAPDALPQAARAPAAPDVGETASLASLTACGGALGAPADGKLPPVSAAHVPAAARAGGQGGQAAIVLAGAALPPAPAAPVGDGDKGGGAGWGKKSGGLRAKMERRRQLLAQAADY